MIRRHKRAMGVGAAGMLLLAGACAVGDVLDVNNPDEIQLDDVNDPQLLEVRMNGVVDAFNGVYAEDIIEFATFLTDEMITGLNWETHARVNQRIASWQEGPTAGIFEGLSRALRLADGLAEHIRGWAEDNPERDFDPDLAQALIYAGYSAMVLAENMCQVVISEDADNPSGDVLDPLATFQVAIDYLEEALSVAQAAGEDDLADLALTGLARAHLGRGEWSTAAGYADDVSSGFEYWIEFVDISGGRNPLQNTSHGGNFTHGIHPNFTGTHPSFDGTGFAFRDNDVIDPQTDPRIQHHPTDATGHNGLTPLYKFFQGLRYGDYNGETIAPASASCPDCTGTAAADMPLLAEFDTDMLMADYLEAQHHLHEALAMQGGAANEAAVLAFVNARRAVGNQGDAGVLTGQALIEELRNQRARDLFMGGFRVPDLRRWTRFDPGNGPFANGSYFPTGQHPNFPVWSDYEEWTCFPIPRSEYEGNANLEQPLDPTIALDPYAAGT